MSTPDGGALVERVTQLEEDLKTVIWLHAELSYSWKLWVATQIAQQVGPQMQQAIVDRLMGAGV